MCEEQDDYGLFLFFVLNYFFFICLISSNRLPRHQKQILTLNMHIIFITLGCRCWQFFKQLNSDIDSERF